MIPDNVLLLFVGQDFDSIGETDATGLVAIVRVGKNNMQPIVNNSIGAL